MSVAPTKSSSPEDGFESDDPADYWEEGDRPQCNICRDFNERYLNPDVCNNHRYSSLVRSSRDGCFKCKILEKIITGLYKVENASLVAFRFVYEDFALRFIGGGSIGAIELYQAADTPCPWGLAWNRSDHLESTASQASFSWAKDQIQTCLTHHTWRCGDPIALLPTRVIDVGTSSSDTIKVLEAKGLRGKYVTLSHCWGNQTSMPKLTAHTRGQYLEGIPCEALPRTFRDAVMMTRHLKIRYLWIDSLCIIQKDDKKDTPQDNDMHKKDWEHESGKMCSVYQNCYLTLAGLDSRNCEGGLFFQRDKVRIEGDSSKGLYCFSGCRKIAHHASAFPLLLRGWVKQETLLSPRTLFCGKDELIWQCRTHTFCQCEFFPGRSSLYAPGIQTRGFRKLPLAEDPRANFTRPVLIRTWHGIVSDYTVTSLTHITDRLVAIEGIAEYMRSLRNSEYLAGLWADSLAFDLLWASDAYNDGDPTRTTYANPLGKTAWSSNKWLFPTWSWASVEGHTSWKWPGGFISDCPLDVVFIQHINDKSSPANELRLRGVLVPSTLGVIQKALNSRELYCPDLRNQEGIFGADKSVECLRVVRSNKDCFSLVLVCVDEEKRQYERLGLLMFRYSGHPFWKCVKAGAETQVEVPLWWEPSEDWKGEEVELTLI